MRFLIALILNCTCFVAIAQVNCSLYEEDSLCYRACLEFGKEGFHRQGSYYSQKHLEKSIELCPTFSHAYFEKSVAYLKRGYFIEWKKLIDQAIEYDESTYLFYRAWGQFAFLHNYEQSIKDVNRLIEIYRGDTLNIGYSQSGEYHLGIVLGLSYRELDQPQKAIAVFESLLSNKKYSRGLFDDLHLGVTYLRVKEYDKAIDAFKQQIQENEIAEAHYYLSIAYREKQDISTSRKHIVKAKELFDSKQRMFNAYYYYLDQIDESEIVALSNALGN